MVKKGTSIHTINGKRYDALTGNLLHEPIVPRKASRSIDGITGKSQSATKLVKPLPASEVPRSRAAHAKNHHTTPSKTLMRHAVAKPAQQSIKRRAKAQAAVAVAQPSTLITHPTLAKKSSVQAVNPRRAAKAASVSTSSRIAHFSQELALVEQAVEHVAQAANTAFVVPTTPTAPTVVFKADVRAPGQYRKPDIFEQALIRATSHEQPEVVTPSIKRAQRKAARSLRQRMISYGAGAMAVLAIAGFLSFTSSDSMKFRMATRSAGFSATMPGYVPHGFSVASVRSINGYVNVSYQRNQALTNASRTYAVTQKPSSITTQTLMDNVASSDSSFNTLQTPQGPVFMYGHNQAAWVRKGVLFQVLGNGVLTTQDFTQIATSL